MSKAPPPAVFALTDRVSGAIKAFAIASPASTAATAWMGASTAFGLALGHAGTATGDDACCAMLRVDPACVTVTGNDAVLYDGCVHPTLRWLPAGAASRRADMPHSVACEDTRVPAKFFERKLD